MPATRRTVKLALAALAALAMQACAAESTGPSAAGAVLASGEVSREGEGGDGSAAGEELRAARERWEGAGVEDYRYTLRTVCSCVPVSFVVEVRGGEPTSVTPLDGGRDALEAGVDSLDNFRELFDRVQAAMESGPDALKVEYDREWGYPLYLWVDPTVDAADEDFGWLVEKFEPLR